MNQSSNQNSLIQKMSLHKNAIFLFMCLGVHVAYMIVFFLMKANFLSVLNLISTLFFIVFIVIAKNKEQSERIIVISYFEIILFSFNSELLTVGNYGFIYFTLGMVSVVFYLAPSFGDKRFRFQIIGMIAALGTFFSNADFVEKMLPASHRLTSEYAKLFYTINLAIALFTIVYTSFFYEVELEMVKNTLDYNSNHDALTGLYNRRFLYRSINRESNTFITAVILDIDNFKKINDNFGHDKGDEVLQKISECIKSYNTSDHYACRWGGEEFVIYYHCSDAETAYKKVSSLCSKISSSVILPDNTAVTVTAGLSEGRPKDFDSVIKKADDYLYIGKKSGKNRIVWYKNEQELASSIS